MCTLGRRGNYWLTYLSIYGDLVCHNRNAARAVNSLPLLDQEFVRTTARQQLAMVQLGSGVGRPTAPPRGMVALAGAAVLSTALVGVLYFDEVPAWLPQGGHDIRVASTEEAETAWEAQRPQPPPSAASASHWVPDGSSIGVAASGRGSIGDPAAAETDAGIGSGSAAPGPAVTQAGAAAAAAAAVLGVAPGAPQSPASGEAHTEQSSVSVAANASDLAAPASGALSDGVTPGAHEAGASLTESATGEPTRRVGNVSRTPVQHLPGSGQQTTGSVDAPTTTDTFTADASDGSGSVTGSSASASDGIDSTSSESSPTNTTAASSSGGSADTDATTPSATDASTASSTGGMAAPAAASAAFTETCDGLKGFGKLIASAVATSKQRTRLCVAPSRSKCSRQLTQRCAVLIPAEP